MRSGENKGSEIVIEERKTDDGQVYSLARVVRTQGTQAATQEKDDVRDGLSVEFLCGARRGARCPPMLPAPPEERRQHHGVGFFLMSYALAYYSRYRPTSVSLYTRRWCSRPANGGKKQATTSAAYADGSIVHYYQKHFGLQFVPQKTQLLDTKDAVTKAIVREIGLQYLQSEYPDHFSSSSVNRDELLNEAPEFCHIYNLLAAVSKQGISLSTITTASGNSSMFDSNYQWSEEAAETAKAPPPQNSVLVESIGFMFRHYPHLVELNMRLLEQFSALVKRKREKQQPLEEEEEYYRFGEPLRADNDAMQRFADRVETDALQRFANREYDGDVEAAKSDWEQLDDDDAAQYRESAAADFLKEEDEAGAEESISMSTLPLLDESIADEELLSESVAM